MKGKPSKRFGTSRGKQAQLLEARRGLDPTSWRKGLLANEFGTILSDAPFRVGLCYPLPYRTAMSSLGFQVIYRMLNSRSFIAAERIFLPDDVPLWRQRGWQPLGLESGRPLGSFDLLAFSITYDLDITGFFDLLDMAGVPILRDERGPHDPPILLGGPLTASNALPFGPFIDLAVIGDGEAAVEALLDILDGSPTREELLSRASTIPGVWVPELHGDRVPAVQKVMVGLPAYGQIVTASTEFSNMFLVEGSRGCPRYCKFCMVRATESPMRESEVERVLARVPAHAARVGFVGAAVSEWSGIREALRRVVAQGKGASVSSLRADRLDEDFVGLLAAAGYRTMTIASDAPSQRLRNSVGKAIREKHLWRSAELGKAAGMQKAKLYVIIGLPGETDADIDELITFSKGLAGLLPTALGISPLVPKLHTPLGDAEFAGLAVVDARLQRIRRELGATLDVRSTSAKWAWIEYRMSQGAEDAGLAALAAWRAGGGFPAWRAALENAEERGALHAARRHDLWKPAGMR